MAEINYRFVKENNIPVIRRISGGGTVYHDEGNLNFTFLQNGEEGNLVNFKAFISPVAAFLKELGAPAVIGPRNDILLDGLKVSGNAEHIYRKRTLHHGTLLFSSTLTDLRNALHTESGKYTDKAVKSVRSKVTNIKENIAGDWTTDQFFHSFADFLKQHFLATPLQLSEENIREIEIAANSKYSGWEWNYGYSPAYIFTNRINNQFFNLSVELHVEKGIVNKAHIEGEYDKSFLSKLSASLTKSPHDYESISGNELIIQLGQGVKTESREIIWSFF
jgi:lipoate-protein ligase A